jgi:hypothetical protein
MRGRIGSDILAWGRNVGRGKLLLTRIDEMTHALIRLGGSDSTELAEVLALPVQGRA